MERKKIAAYTAIASILIAVVLIPGHMRLKKLKEENERYKKRIEILKEHNEVLEKELLMTTEDPDYIEKKARDKLGIVKKGEVIYKIKNDGD